MEENLKTIDVCNGKILVPMIDGSVREINLKKLQGLLEWDVPGNLNEVILCMSQISCEIIRSYSNVADMVKMQVLFPSPDALYVVGQVSDTFKKEY